MALHVPRAPGFQSMMKDGAQFFSGVEEAVVRNIGKHSQATFSCIACHGMHFKNDFIPGSISDGTNQCSLVSLKSPDDVTFQAVRILDTDPDNISMARCS